MSLLILVQKTYYNAIRPFIAKPGDAGFDLTCAEGGIVWPFSTRDFSIGWKIKIPEGYWGSIKARSSTLMKRKLFINEGVVDSGYTGELSVLVFNPTWLPKRIKIGDRLAQLIIIPQVEIEEIKDAYSMPLTMRGESGFGSTGE